MGLSDLINFSILLEKKIKAYEMAKSIMHIPENEQSVAEYLSDKKVLASIDRAIESF